MAENPVILSEDVILGADVILSAAKDLSACLAEFTPSISWLARRAGCTLE
jgi:hypothetical protein